MDDEEVNLALPAVFPAGIDPDDDRELDLFSARLGASVERVREAIAAVGPMPEAIRYYLKSKSAWSRPVTAQMKVAFAVRRQSRMERRAKAGRDKQGVRND